MTVDVRSVLSACLPVLLGVTVLCHARGRGFSVGVAASSSALVTFQPAFLIRGMGIHWTFLVLTLFATASSSLALLNHQEPRRIVMFGTSLAGTQLAIPLCGVAATVMLPFALRKSLESGGSRLAGLFVSLLFLPVLVSVAFLYLLIRGRMSAQWPLLPWAAVLRLGWAPALLAFLPACVALWWFGDARRTPVFGVLAASVLLASYAAVVAGREYLFAECSAALSSLLYAYLSDLTSVLQHARGILVFLFGNSVWIWTVDLLFRSYWHA